MADEVVVIGEIGTVPGPEDPMSPMQRAVIESGAVPIIAAPVQAFRTNQGTVYLGSPADIARQELMDRRAPYVDRTRKWTMPGLD